MSREQLKATKKSFEFESERCGVAMPMLEFYTAFVIGAKMPVLILIFNGSGGRHLRPSRPWPEEKRISALYSGEAAVTGE